MAEENVKPRISYDKSADVLYINFGDDEPTFTEDFDDNEIIMLEIGCFSGLPKGFRIISPRKHKIQQFNFQVVVKQIKNIMEERIKAIRQQEPALTKIAADEISQALSMVN